MQTEIISIIKEQYDKIQEIYRNKSATLVKEIEKSKNKLHKTEQRRGLELEGYHEDLRLLEKKVKFYEDYTQKLKTLVEQDAWKMLKRLREENDKLADGREDEDWDEVIPGNESYGGIPTYKGPRAPWMED